MLARTLAPPAEAGGDPFGSIFATRAVPGSTTVAKRATSKRGRKKAQAALQGLNDDVDGIEVELSADTEGRRARHGSRRQARREGQSAEVDDDASSQGDASEVSSASSEHSTYSGGGKRLRPGQRKQHTNRFAKTWGAGGDGSDAVADWATLEAALASSDGGDGDDDTRSQFSTAASDASSACSQLSIETTECLAKGDIAGAIGSEFGQFRIRSAQDANPAERRQRLKRRRAPGECAGGMVSDAGIVSVSDITAARVTREASRQSNESDAANAGNAAAEGPKGPGLADRLARAASGLEETAVKRLDSVGRAMRPF